MNTCDQKTAEAVPIRVEPFTKGLIEKWGRNDAPFLIDDIGRVGAR